MYRHTDHEPFLRLVAEHHNRLSAWFWSIDYPLSCFQDTITFSSQPCRFHALNFRAHLRCPKCNMPSIACMHLLAVMARNFKAYHRATIFDPFGPHTSYHLSSTDLPSLYFSLCPTFFYPPRCPTPPSERQAADHCTGRLPGFLIRKPETHDIVTFVVSAHSNSEVFQSLPSDHVHDPNISAYHPP